MTLLELVTKANKGYEDGFLSEYFNEETGEYIEGKGDTLAAFIVIELSETFDSEADDEDQIQAATEALQTAVNDLEGVIDALYGQKLIKDY